MKDPVPHSLVGIYTEIRLDLSPDAAAKAKEGRVASRKECKKLASTYKELNQPHVNWN